MMTTPSDPTFVPDVATGLTLIIMGLYYAFGGVVTRWYATIHLTRMFRREMRDSDHD